MIWIFKVVILFLILIILYLLWKIVFTPTLTVTTDKPEYVKNETVDISGSLEGFSGAPIAGETVTITITPPSGSDYIVPDATTQTDGSFSEIWEIPSDAVDGTYTVTVVSMNVLSDTTFT